MNAEIVVEDRRGSEGFRFSEPYLLEGGTQQLQWQAKLRILVQIDFSEQSQVPNSSGQVLELIVGNAKHSQVAELVKRLRQGPER